eukprot:897268-Prorocentrum_minimum.AAC.1
MAVTYRAMIDAAAKAERDDLAPSLRDAVDANDNVDNSGGHGGHDDGENPKGETSQEASGGGDAATRGSGPVSSSRV